MRTLDNSHYQLSKEHLKNELLPSLLSLFLFSYFCCNFCRITIGCRRSSVDSSGTFHPTTPGSNPMHTIYAFININLNCERLKRRK